MRFARLIALIPTLAGLISIASAVYGFRSVDFIESSLTTARFFDNPDYGSASSETWRSGYMNAMGLFLGFGVLALVAAVALFYRQRWGKYLWLTLVVVAAASAIPGLPHDNAAWLWLAGCMAVLAISWLGLRKSDGATAAAP